MMLPAKTVFLIIIISEAVYSRELAEGPLNITRTTGEVFVAIPCPFSGRYQVVWKINDVVYEMFSLPYKYGTQFIPISSGLLIPHITNEFEGQNLSFQCFYPEEDGLGFHASTIGIMNVMKPSFDAKLLFDEETYGAVSLNGLFEQLMLDIDHQRLFFGPENKTLAWKIAMESSEATLCDYRIIRHEGCSAENKCTPCEDAVIDEWQSYNETIVTVEAKSLSHNGVPVRLNIVQFDDHHECSSNTSLREMVQLNEAVNTEELKTSTFGELLITQYVSSHLAIPSVDNNLPDCSCPYYAIESEDCFDFKLSCPCFKQTAFYDSSSELRVCRIMSTDSFKLQITNITNKINGTKLHIYEGYSRCAECENIHCPYRKYVKALILTHVLPEPPEVSTSNNYTTFCFVSQKVEGILLDHHEVVITDITKEVFFRDTYNNSQCVDDSTEGLFHSDVCSPFTLSVRAVNIFGQTITNKTVNQGSQAGHVCSCIHARVDADVSVTPDVLSVHAEVLEYSKDYTSDLEYEIRLSECHNETNFTSCSNESKRINKKQYSVSFQDLICQQQYVVQLFWISNDNVYECLLNETITAPSCPDSLVIIISTSLALAVCVLAIINVIAVIVILCRKRRESASPGTTANAAAGTNDYGTCIKESNDTNGTSL